DEIVQKKKTTGFTVMTALMSIINYYFFFGQVVFMILYYLVRYFPVRGIRKAVPEVFYIILHGCAGLLLAAFFLVQSVAGVSGNSRLDNYINGYGVIAYKDGTTPFAILKSLFVVPDIIAKPTLFSNDQVKNGSLAAYLPCFSLSGVIAYWTIFSGTWKKRMAAVCAVMALIPALNAVYSAFNSNYYARWFYMPLLVLASMTARALETGRHKDLHRGAKITAIITLAIMLCAVIPTMEDGKVKWLSICDNMDLLVIECLSTAIQLMLMITVLAALPGVKGARRYRKMILLYATIVSCLLTNLAVLYNGNSLIARTGGVKWRQQMLDTRPSLRDTSTFFRVETDGTSTNYEMVWGYPTIHCFESTVSPSIFTFYRKIGMIRTVESTLPIDRIGARALLSVRYYTENDLVRPSETLEDKGGLIGYEEGLPNSGYKIYENTNYIPMGFTFTTYLREEEYDSMRKGEMTDRLLVKDLILTEEQVAKYGRYMEEDMHADEEIMSEQEFQRACSKRSESACSEFAFDNAGFSARINLPSENLVFFSVPYDEGFTAQVDGVQVPIEKVDGGLMAIPVPEGTHEIRFTYLPKGFNLCCAISAITAILLLVHGVHQYVRLRKTNVLALENNA
ncbi:MAG: YfhO family protein, partial [Lachnospiraceae bacterium]|nr:YfhO family protein [Lachnospiraceae bacterium]